MLLPTSFNPERMPWIQGVLRIAVPQAGGPRSQSGSRLMVLSEDEARRAGSAAAEVPGISEFPHEFVTEDWLAQEPIPAETCQLLRQGYQMLYDPQGYFSALCYAFEKQEGCLLAPRIKVSEVEAQTLIAEQFPQWKHLPLKPVALEGWCNNAFRLGAHLLVKFPRAERYERSHQIEYQWLSRLRPHVSVAIPEPLALAEPCADFPWHWTVSRWIEGQTAVHLPEKDRVQFALDLAQFLQCLWTAPADEGPSFFEQRFFRGAPLRVYAQESSEALAQLDKVIDTSAARQVWQKATQSYWPGPPVWVHGDLFPANILIQHHTLHAVIDFGSMCLGDPACDLVMAWTFFEGESRQAFMQALQNTGMINAQTWERARGWALWKAFITLASLDNKSTENARKTQALIETLIEDDAIGVAL